MFQEGSGEQAQASDALEGFAVLPEHADLAPLQAALQLLGRPEPAQPQRSSPAGAAASGQSASSSGFAGLHPLRASSQGDVPLSHFGGSGLHHPGAASGAVPPYSKNE